MRDTTRDYASAKLKASDDPDSDRTTSRTQSFPIREAETHAVHSDADRWLLFSEHLAGVPRRETLWSPT